MCLAMFHAGGYVATCSLATEEFVRSTAFETSVAAVILMNCATIGIEVNSMVDTVSDELLQLANICEHVFCAFFLLEFFGRLCFLGCRTYLPCVPSAVSTGEQVQNFMDGCLVWGTGVFMSWIVPLVGISAGKLRIFTVLRAFRLLRLVRVVRKLPAFNEVYLLIRGLSASTRTLFWTVVVVFLITYIFAIFGVVLISAEVLAALDVVSNDPLADSRELEDLEMLKDSTGSLTAWMFTLIQVLTLDSWNGIARPLQRYVPGSWIFFYSYIAVAVIVFMNLVTAVIVENALSHSKQDEETLLAQKDLEEKRLLKTFRALFEVMDEDNSGTLTLEEFQSAFETKEVATKLKLLGFKEMDCQSIFNLLDEGDGSLTIDEFFEGLQEMKGPAQAKQCFMMRKRVEQIWNLLMQFSHEVDQDLNDIVQGQKRQRMGSLLQRARQVSRSLTPSTLGKGVLSPKSPKPTAPVKGSHESLRIDGILSIKSNGASPLAVAPAGSLRSDGGQLERLENMGRELRAEMHSMTARMQKMEAVSMKMLQRVEELAFEGAQLQQGATISEASQKTMRRECSCAVSRV
ncbi:unnamed protein product [Effrenium voratum]|uniref:EF-hand domain-containing protein n=1 Tax=Effrenium voratum TaxID=2562239 RepID=A0AA36HWV3_9DINO|nr:unnamed protein product [Effrenium voratum]